jgi:hypothetical protein
MYTNPEVEIKLPRASWTIVLILRIMICVGLDDIGTGVLGPETGQKIGFLPLLIQKIVFLPNIRRHSAKGKY